VITKADVPPEWTSKKATSTDRGLRGIADCKQINKAVDNANRKVPRARSREFLDPNSLGTMSAESAVYVFGDLRRRAASSPSTRIPTRSPVTTREQRRPRPSSPLRDHLR
jgi:hypothetical protein